MKKALYLHGFLGSPQDMEPLFLKGYECESFDVRKILFEENYIQALSEQIGFYDFILGYSFGGRLLEELKRVHPDKAKNWIFVSSRHSSYPEEELKSREVFRGLIYSKLDSRAAFFEYWKSLPLFGGHQMDEYRAEHKLGYTPWTTEEIDQYLEFFFTSPQIDPVKCENTSFIHGLGDEKYSKEGERLKDIFNVFSLQGGHRFLFEKPEEFKLMLQKILG